MSKTNIYNNINNIGPSIYLKKGGRGSKRRLPTMRFFLKNQNFLCDHSLGSETYIALSGDIKAQEELLTLTEGLNPFIERKETQQ